MHYYQFNIGDYKTHTSHLTPIEDICYRRLLDYYYLHEKPLINDIEKLTRLVVLNGYSTDVEQVLNEFFILIDGCWYNNRADAEINAYKELKDSKSKAGKASAAKRLSQSSTELNTCSTDVQLNINHKPLTNNHKQDKNITPLAMLIAMGISENIAKDWIKVRKEKKQAITQTALDRIKSHAESNQYTFEQAIKICVENSWAGFNIKWLENQTSNNLKDKQKSKMDISGIDYKAGVNEDGSF